ncbi:protein MpABCG19 [Marchantia polymorpha subsp. ruderalis]|nr:hypothetical protein MARPO_0084s0042 [Marchantia polymorpha]PTQ33955.1 hypothetical protein MARPO_0084s0042 [Marchantia polymorpha]BBN12168.1 hypothetical protein Mp_5g17950 [Marchantia polymorpha subsp. ruderalis]BBN12169.1 hypothetical protein Mp_5g17950 [Marchantia polymorpha subsp. ruderalis]|eukprot:PTQ33954.1 hypothetical protein MARPO_0084s0042 [Marchantia polymorpha]
MGNLYSRSPDPVMYISSPRMMDGAPLKQGCLSMTRWQSINLRGLEEARTHKDEKITYDLSIRNLQYKVQVKEKGGATKDKVLLNNISAKANHGEVLAIAGPSGSSKSTLLDALAGRIDRRSLRGSILVNGMPIDQTFRRVSGYVMQDDALYPVLTVRETLMFSARLRLPSTWTDDQRMARVEIILAELGLQPCADLVIGDDLVRGVSRGEKRRVSIAVDLMHDPAVLFLDKPTTGLDSFSAFQVMQKLHTLAEVHNRTVIITIHQPNHSILELIHNTLLLIQGNVIFSGHHSGLVNYFSDIGYNMPEYVNPLEYALDTMQKVKTSSVGVTQLLELKVVKEKEKIMDGQAARELDAEATASSRDLDDDINMTFATSFRSELYVLGERNVKLILRTRPLFFARMAVLVVGGLVTSTFFRTLSYDMEGVTKRLSMTAFLLAYCSFTSTQVLPIFLQERSIFIREASRGAYRPVSFVLCQILAHLPFLFVQALAFSILTYFIAGWANNVGAVGYYVWMWFLVLILAQSMAACCAGWIPNIIICQAVLSATLSFFMLFSGFFLRKDAIPKGWLWLHYLSGFKYPYEGLLVNEFTSLWNTNWGDDQTNVNFYQVLEKYDLEHVSLVNSVFVMTFFIIFYRGLYYLAFVKSARDVRK